MLEIEVKTMLQTIRYFEECEIVVNVTSLDDIPLFSVCYSDGQFWLKYFKDGS
ncbi:hypothetical protein MEZE111188_12830 [Mesobacillus zeae]